MTDQSEWDKLKEKWGLTVYDPNNRRGVSLNLETIKEMRRIGDLVVAEGDRMQKLAEDAKYSLLNYKHMDADTKHVDYAIGQLESIFNKGKRSI